MATIVFQRWREQTSSSSGTQATQQILPGSHLSAYSEQPNPISVEDQVHQSESRSIRMNPLYLEITEMVEAASSQSGCNSTLSHSGLSDPHRPCMPCGTNDALARTQRSAYTTQSPGKLQRFCVSNRPRNISHI
jgi:hypothetical protein